MDHTIESISSVTEFTAHEAPNKQFSSLTEKYSPPEFSDEQFHIARTFTDSHQNYIVQTIKSSGGMLRRDTATKLQKKPQAEKDIDNLIQQGIIQSEYVILCKKTSEQLNRVPSLETITWMGERGVRCSRCDRPIAEELIEEILTTTTLANEMLNGSHWMTINLVECLISLGIPRTKILVNVTEGPEEIDAIVSIGNKLLMFELKDSQFSMGHAYPFQSRIGLYEPDKAVIWASNGVAPEVKEHFGRAKLESDLFFIETVNDLESRLKELIHTVWLEIAENTVAHLSPKSMFIYNVPGGIMAKLKTLEKGTV